MTRILRGVTNATRILALAILLAASFSGATAPRVLADGPDPATVLSTVARDLGLPAPTREAPKGFDGKSRYQVKFTVLINPEEKNLPEWIGSGLTGKGAPKGTWQFGFFSTATGPTPTEFGNYLTCETELLVFISDSRESAEIRSFGDSVQKALSGGAGLGANKLVALGEAKAIEHTEGNNELKELTWIQGDWVFSVHRSLNFDGVNASRCSFNYDSGPDALAVAEKLYQVWKASTAQAPPSTKATATAGPASKIPLTIDGGWLRVATDGISKLDLTAQLPAGVTAKEAKFYFQDDDAWVAKNMGEFANQKISGGKVTATYVPPAGFPTQEHAELLRLGTATGGIYLPIEVAITDSNGQAYVGDVDVTVVQPPVVLVHGIWSEPKAWEPAAAALKKLGFRYVFTDFGYKDRNNGDPAEIAGLLSNYLNSDRGPIKGPIQQALDDKTLASRYDLVGHSLGGLIIRRAIADGTYQHVRKVITVGTPHQGSEFADSFVYFSRNHLDLGPLQLPTPTTELGRVGQANASLPPKAISDNEKWKAGHTEWQHEFFDWLVSRVKLAKGLDPSFFVDGPAVTALQPKSQFLSALNAADAHDGVIKYYFIYGDRPILSKDSAEYASIGVALLGGAEGKMSSPIFVMSAEDWDKFGKHTEDDQVVVDTLLDFFSMEDIDGVVSTASARGEGLSFKPKQMARISGDHVSLTSDAIPWIYWYLAGREGPVDHAGASFTSGQLHSPAHLNAYDDKGRHVGLDKNGKVEVQIPGATFVGPEEQTGVPETILVMSDAPVRFEVTGYQEGKFGLTVRRNGGSSDQEVSYKDVPIKPGQTASLQLESGRYSDLATPGGKIPPNELINRPVENGGPGSALAIGLVALAALVLGGGALRMRKSGRKSALQPPPAGVALAPSAVATQPSVAPAPAPVPQIPVGPAPAGFCARCGQPVTVGSSFCAGCGQPVTQGPRHCSSCGQKLVAGAGFCPNCGVRTSGAPPGPPVAAVPVATVAAANASLVLSPAHTTSKAAGGKPAGLLFLGGLVSVALTGIVPPLFVLDIFLIGRLWKREARKRAVFLALLLLGALALFVMVLNSAGYLR